MQALTISIVLLWACVIVLAAVVLALTRQVGLLHERVSPAGALMPAGGPSVGDEAPELLLEALDGEPLSVGGIAVAARSTLLFFLSPTCPVCKTLLPTLLRVARDEADGKTGPRIVLASDGDPHEHRIFVEQAHIQSLPYVVSPELGMRYAVGKLPYAVLIDGQGVIRAKGIVNTREHLESLFEAERRGVASIQDYLRGDASEGEAA